ncbi:plasmid mobilization protein [Conexibacter arvalis]|uniref:Uncharacterized protein (DUF1778 family) n=1 Tax=Conexibacter arvalis TaxID=912552 RepID=A0A840IM71_9ACTN|nr:hypothetical protein [Conexibacter arvalis]MBB4664960.1 uncharacterized protein (DUF1778 family) [Conexibacter arvalis]
MSRNEVIQFRVSESEKASIAQEAARRGRSVASYLRTVALASAPEAPAVALRRLPAEERVARLFTEYLQAGRRPADAAFSAKLQLFLRWPNDALQLFDPWSPSPSSKADDGESPA